MKMTEEKQKPAKKEVDPTMKWGGVPHTEEIITIPNPYDNKRSVSVKAWKFKVPWLDGEKEVVVRKLLFGEANQLTSTYLKIDIIGSTARPKFEYQQLLEQTVLKTVHTAPWTTKDILEVKSLDPDVGDIVYAKADGLNDINAIKKTISGVSTEKAVQQTEQS